MKPLLFFIAAQLAANGITLLLAASLAHLLRRRLAAKNWIDKLTDEQYDALYCETAGEPELLAARKVGAPC